MIETVRSLKDKILFNIRLFAMKIRMWRLAFFYATIRQSYRLVVFLYLKMTMWVELMGYEDIVTYYPEQDEYDRDFGENRYER